MSFYTVHQYILAQGASVERLHAFLASTWLDAAGQRPVLILEGVVTAPLPQVLVITEDGTSVNVNEPTDLAYESLAVHHLRATPYSPPLRPNGNQTRYFEHRLYQAANAAQLTALHERFAGPEIPIFHRCGIHPVLYAETIAGAKMPNLVYFTPFETLAEREQAWNTFRADPEWIRVRTEHAQKYGPVPKAIEIALYKATSYSPVR